MKSLTYSKIAFSLVTACWLLSSAITWAQPADEGPSVLRRVSFRDYLEAVEKYSLDLQNQHQNITSAKAGLLIAGIRPDPQLTAGISSTELNAANRPNTATASTAGLAITIETAGKRGKRIRAAESNTRLTESSVQAFLRDLQSQSASAFIEGWRTREALVRKQSSLRSFQEVVRANEIRFKVGEIGMLELRQSRVEADRFRADVTTAEALAKAAVVNLSGPLGKRFKEVFPEGGIHYEFKREARPFEVEHLIRQALENRPDVLVAKSAVENAQANLDLARANRWVDPTVNVGLTYTPQVQPNFGSDGNVTNSPTLASSLALGLTISIPIPFSRLQRGEVIQAESALRQARLQLDSVQHKTETDVGAIYLQYQAAALNVQSYLDQVLPDADRVLEGILTSYRKGAASLLELLNAKRTADDVYLSYLQALADLANSTVNLQLSAGLRPDL
jgi:cobalt-zinc-cadmium efflux system outer membrane protein